MLKNNRHLTFRESSLLSSFIDEITDVFYKLESSNQEVLNDYYKVNIDFFNSVIKGTIKIDVSTCLQSAKASLEYLKLFL